MKTNATKTAKTSEQMKKDYLKEVSAQVAMALESNDTPEAVKDCLKTIIIEASTEADMTLSDFSLVRSALPNIIEKLGDDYGRGFLHAIGAIVRYDTTAFKDFYEQRLDEKPDKPATETPVMTEEEMQRFISVIANAEHIQGDYVHNGFLCFFQSIYEAIKENPVEAQNLMFHLQQHVFNKMMWESFWAFDAHRKKAHSIFSSTEPYIYYEEDEEENKSDIEEKPKTGTCK